MKRIGALAGMFGSALFVAIVSFEDWFRPGWDPLRMYVSELSLGPRGWLPVAAFVVAGACLLLFAGGLALEFRDGPAGPIGPLAVGAVGVAMAALGAFVIDPISTPRDAWTASGLLHLVFAAFSFGLAPLSLMLFWQHFRLDPAWRQLDRITLLVMVLVVLAIVAMNLGPSLPPNPPNDLNAWAGLIQRIGILPYMAWLFLVGLVLFERSRRQQTATASVPQAG